MSERKRRPARRRPPERAAGGDPLGLVLLRVAGPLLAGGAIALALSNATPLRSWVSGLFATRTRAMRSVIVRFAAGERPLGALRTAIVGSAKGAVHTVFGPPRTAMLRHAATPARSFWQADTWYYPLPKNGPLAMAIEFQGDDARRVEFLRAPEA